MREQEATKRLLHLLSVVGVNEYKEQNRKGLLLLHVLNRCREFRYVYPNWRDPFAPLQRITYDDFQRKVTQKSAYSELNAAILLLLEDGAELNRLTGRRYPETAMDIALMDADADVAHTLRTAGAKYSYELGCGSARAWEEEVRNSITPISLPEPEEWHTSADVLNYARLCTRLCGLEGWQWKLKRENYMGCCHHTSNTLVLNPAYLTRGHLEIRITIIHELAHAMAGHRASHGPIWKLWGAALGLYEMKKRGAVLHMPQKYGLLDFPAP